MNDELADRRRAALERVKNRRTAETLERLCQEDATARRLARSIRHHPSNPRIFDWEAES